MSMNEKLFTFSISRKESNAIKGLLIILVVFGHNSILCSSWDGCVIIDRLFYWRWLYTFHVYCFFILPFVYNQLPYRKGNLDKYALRLLYPYIWSCLGCLLINLFVLDTPFNGWLNLLKTMFWGSEKLLEENIGLIFPWFLPAMFSLLLLKDVYYSVGLFWKSVLWGIGLMLWVVVLVSDVKFSTLGTYVPLALVPAFRLLPVCLVALWLVKHINNNSMVIRSVIIVIFGVLTLLYWLVLTNDIHSGRMAFYFVMPVSVFLIIYLFRDYLAKSHLLIALGKMSIQIYLYHVILFNALLLIVKRFHCPPSFIDGIVLFFITLIVSYGLARLITHVRWIKCFLYPECRKCVD